MTANFKFIQNEITGGWVISAPKRAERPDSATDSTPVCPFCPGREKDEREVYRVGGEIDDSNWLVRVLPNKFPFAPIHEVIIHSPDHHKNFDELPASQTELILKTYRQRYQTHTRAGLPAGRQVYIFHNRGEAGGESLPHPHSQLAVIPENIKLDIPPLNPEDFANEEQRIETPHFLLFCPETSQWPDEVWATPKSKIKDQKSKFGEINDEQITDLANVLSRLVQIFNLRHGNEFPYNFYIYPGSDWYLRLIPRIKILGGFEIGTGVFVNTTDPKDTLDFLKENLK